MEVMELRERLEEAANEEEAGAVRDDNARKCHYFAVCV